MPGPKFPELVQFKASPELVRQIDKAALAVGLERSEWLRLVTTLGSDPAAAELAHDLAKVLRGLHDKPLAREAT